MRSIGNILNEKVLTLAFVAVLCAAPASSQSPVAAVTPSPVALVYLQQQNGVNVYSANAAGQLTLLPGSPFPDTGQMEGVEGGYLISVGTNYLHSYRLAANGAVGSQASQINTASYGGGECGSTIGPALLDHTGDYFSVQLTGSSSNACSALQTYKIASNGEFTFLGDQLSTLANHDDVYEQTVSTYSSNDLLAYGVQDQVDANVFLPFKRGAAGDLVTDSAFTQTGPASDPTMPDSTYFPYLLAADPSSHLAGVMYQPFTTQTNYFQLAGFTINNGTGAITSTNNYTNMPVLQVYPSSLAMSWDGSVLAVGGCPGLQLFHFNGANPPTPYGAALPENECFPHVAWDKKGHLYAISDSQLLYAYSLTPAGLVPVPGSPYNVKGPYGLVEMLVVPKS